jgi:hypothetical protein
MSSLTGRYGGSPESTFDQDIRQIETKGLASYANSVIETQLSDNFWSTFLPQQMDTSVASSPYFQVYQAAQVKMNDLGFLSRDIPVRDLLLNRSDVHHVYPKNYLTKQGLTRSRYNQIANFVIAQTEINVAIGDKAPESYFADLREQSHGGQRKYGGITDGSEMKRNFEQNCIPVSMLSGTVLPYDEFLKQRRALMAEKINHYFAGL